MMTRKHFEAIARIFAGHPAIRSSEVKSIGYDIADYLGTQNPNFDRARFLKAAGIYSEDES
jgi:hypothetical protein